MQRYSGIAELPLHNGKTPRWLFEKMVKLSKGITTVIIEEFGTDEFLRRLSDPYWFQALACVLGYDWHSSGTTTVTCGALKEALKNANLGIKFVGGKGIFAKKTLAELEAISEDMNLSTKSTAALKYASRLSAKVDNALLQDGYELYHHCMAISESAKWAVIQQGLCKNTRTARRYHWLSENVKSFVNEPHTGIVSERVVPEVLDMRAKESEDCRNVSVDLVKEGVKKIHQSLRIVKTTAQTTLDIYSGKNVKILALPQNVNWEVLKKIYDIQPKDYESLISIKGVGKSTVRALALISEVIYGSSPSWKDPVKYTFAHGGKDGVPFPVKRKVYDKSIEVLISAIENAKLENREKLEAIRRARFFI